MGLIGGAAQMIGGMIGGKKRRKEQRAANKQFNQRMSQYENFDIQNSYGGVGNPAANLTNFGSDLGNPGANLNNFAAGMSNTAQGATNFASQMQNTAEDLTVNTQQAEFQAQQQNQGMSNIMSNMKGAAGSSGIAALAQTLAGQQSQNMQQASASIGMQESSNAAMAAQQGANIQSAIASESSMNQARSIDQASQNQILSAQMASGNQQFGAQMGNQNAMFGATMGNENQRFGATMDFQGQMARASGAQNQQQMQFDRQATLLGISGQRKGAADQARADAKGQIIGGIGQIGDAGMEAVGAILGAGG
tara:strand:- start:975 stop:1895 length:921 start_codon:yes stop_codon:yes gene_type:complete